MKKFIFIFVHYAAIFFMASLIVTISFSIYTPIFGEIQSPSYYLGFSVVVLMYIAVVVLNKLEKFVSDRMERRSRKKTYDRICELLAYHKGDFDDTIIKTAWNSEPTVGKLKEYKKQMEEYGWDS